jgi:nucleotide-binding universal stress UspA family protein
VRAGSGGAQVLHERGLAPRKTCAGTVAALFESRKETVMIKKILVAVDGSLPAIHAAKKALELAKPVQAEVTLIHVEAPSVLPGDMPFAPIADLREAELARGAGILKNTLAALEGTGIKTLNLLGAPAEVIADTAMDEGFDLVVVGNKGRGAVSRVLIGSVADRLVHICKRPVLVVR